MLYPTNSTAVVIPAVLTATVLLTTAALAAAALAAAALAAARPPLEGPSPDHHPHMHLCHPPFFTATRLWFDSLAGCGAGIARGAGVCGAWSGVCGAELVVLGCASVWV